MKVTRRCSQAGGSGQASRLPRSTSAERFLGVAQSVGLASRMSQWSLLLNLGVERLVEGSLNGDTGRRCSSSGSSAGFGRRLRRIENT